VITQSRLKELLHYNPDTGVFTWRTKRQGIREGDVAGSIGHKGYWVIKVDQKLYKAHRLAFIYMGEELPPQMDHVNHVRTDNRWANLARSSQAENMKNQRVYSNSPSGHHGVCKTEGGKKWIARIDVDKKRIYLGVFNKKEDAILARRAAEIEYGFHPNHGK